MNRDSDSRRGDRSLIVIAFLFTGLSGFAMGVLITYLIGWVL